jgi:hypothetical protein
MVRFLLYRADSERAVLLEQLVGEFDSFDGAQLARDWDVLRQLEWSGGRRIELGHVIVDRAGGVSRRMVCWVGQPVDEPVEASAEVAATAEWLARRHRR